MYLCYLGDNSVRIYVIRKIITYLCNLEDNNVLMQFGR